MHKRLTIILTLWLLAIGPSRAQWTEPVRIGEPGAMQHPQILAQGDTLHVVYTSFHERWKIGYLRSTDAGDSWSDQRVLSDTVNTTQTRLPGIIANGNSLMALWLCYFWQGIYNYNIGISISLNNGLTWEESEYVINPGWTYPFSPSASADGNIINIETFGAPDDTVLFHNIRSVNFGQNWSDPQELFRIVQGGRADQAAFADNVFYIWSGRFTFDEEIEIYYMRSTDDGTSWSQSIPLSDIDDYHSQLPAIDADDYGNVAITWMDFKYAPPGATGDIFIRQSADSGLNWTVENQLTFNHYAFGNDVILNADTIHVVWEDESQSVFHRRIYYINSTDNGASWSEPYWIDGTDDDSWNPALATSNGNVYIVWADNQLPGYGLYFSKYLNQTGIIENEPITPRLAILGAYPNPFNSKVMITFKDLKGGEICIYNISGQKIRTFETTENKEGQIEWDARDALGNKVSTGIYFARARGGRNSSTIKLLYLK